MKNITLSIPDDLLAESRKYAQEHNTSLNQMIRDILASYVQKKDTSHKLLEKSEEYSVEAKDYKWNRDEIYER
jgi:metal-responsive CopG/Arc/MetJ family transcriptional regulator